MESFNLKEEEQKIKEERNELKRNTERVRRRIKKIMEDFEKKVKEDREKKRVLREREEIEAWENHFREFLKLTMLLLEQLGKDIVKNKLKDQELTQREKFLKIKKCKMNP